MTDISKTDGIRELTIEETTQVAGASFGGFNGSGGNPLLTILDHILDHTPGPGARFFDHIIDSFTHTSISDVRAKHDITLLGHLDNGLGYYRFSYNGSDKAYVGVMAQEVETIMPDAVERGSDGYLLVNYDKLGIRLQTLDEWVASGEKIPTPKH